MLIWEAITSRFVERIGPYNYINCNVSCWLVLACQDPWSLRYKYGCRGGRSTQWMELFARKFKEDIYFHMGSYAVFINK